MRCDCVRHAPDAEGQGALGGHRDGEADAGDVAAAVPPRVFKPEPRSQLQDLGREHGQQRHRHQTQQASFEPHPTGALFYCRNPLAQTVWSLRQPEVSTM